MYLIIDCETNGLPRNWRTSFRDLKNWPRAVQIAWALYDDQQRPLAADGCIVRPDGFRIPADTVRIHGITTERALAEGQPIGDVLAALAGAAAQAQVVIAHNANFDGSVIAAEYLRLGQPPPFEPKSMRCTMLASTDHCRLPGPYGYKWPRLDELHRFLFGVTPDGAHDARVDVATCALCFFELKTRGVMRIG